MATAEANTAWLSRQAQEFKAKSHLSCQKTEVLERDQTTGRAVLHWQGFLGTINPTELMAKLSKHKQNVESDVEAKKLAFHQIFFWNTVDDFSISFQKTPKSPASYKYDLCRDFYSKCQVTSSIRNIGDWVLYERSWMRGECFPQRKVLIVLLCIFRSPENYQWQ